MPSIVNLSPVDFKKQPMFFGEDLGIQRYDQFKYRYFNENGNLQLSYFWRPEEVSLQKDISDYKTLNDNQKHIFTSNLKYQILLDSVQGRAPGTAFIPYCSLPELEFAMTIWQMMELIHSKSYTHIIKNLYPNPSLVFDEILEDKKIIERSVNVTKYYDQFINNPSKESLVLAMVNVFILEGIRFYVSFASSFAFAEVKLLEGSSKIISFIARDENVHMALTSYIIKKWIQDEPEMKEIIIDNKQNIYNMMGAAVEEEKAWADYLFQDGSMIGLNANLLHEYVEWLANNRLKKIGFKRLYKESSNSSPLPWMNSWLNSRDIQVAPQETEIESYLVGSIKQDNLSNLNSFSL